jgi:LCP family protein required for cell wall assembly
MDIIRKQKNKPASQNKSLNQKHWDAININQTQSTPPPQKILPHYHTSNKPKSSSYQNSSKNIYAKKVFWISFIILILAIIFAGSFFVYRTNITINKISDSNTKHSFTKTISNLTNSQSYKALQGFESGRINILLLGRANTHKSGKDLTDTIMMASINTQDYTVGLFSLPRDLLVSNGDFYVKINSRYQTGLRNDKGAEYIIRSVENVTGQNINYYFILDFEGFTKIIDILDGININVPRHIKDERYPGPGYSYETFEVYPGIQKFDGTTALKYARTRHDDIEGDFGRAKRQQQVMQAARNKAFSLGTIVNPLKINELLNVLGKHVHTNITPNEIEPFISLIKKIDTHNITNVVIDAWKPNSLLISARYYNENSGISGLVPRSGTYSEIQEQAANLFDLEKLQQRHNEIQNESPTIIIINSTPSKQISHRIKTTLSTLGFDDITLISQSNQTQLDSTIIIDNTNGEKPFSLDELIKKIPATLSTQIDILPTNKINYANTNFVILLGNDIVDTYTYTEISQKELETENAQNTDK